MAAIAPFAFPNNRSSAFIMPPASSFFPNNTQTREHNDDKYEMSGSCIVHAARIALAMYHRLPPPCLVPDLNLVPSLPARFKQRCFTWLPGSTSHVLVPGTRRCHYGNGEPLPYTTPLRSRCNRRFVERNEADNS